MQTFVPEPNIALTAKILDYKRLGKQRVEAQQILDTLEGKTAGWKNHPAVLMWEGYETFLEFYKTKIIIEWILRGYRNNMDFTPEFVSAKQSELEDCAPSWWGGQIHSTHRAALLAKDFSHYSQFGWHEQPELNYHWPR